MGNVAQKSEKSISGAIKINEKEIVLIEKVNAQGKKFSVR